MLSLQEDSLKELRCILHIFNLQNQSLLIATQRKIFDENFKENRVFATQHQIQLECVKYEFNFHWMIKTHTKKMLLEHKLLTKGQGLIFKISLPHFHFQLNNMKKLILLLLIDVQEFHKDIPSNCLKSSRWSNLNFKGQFKSRSKLLEWWTF